MENSLGLYLERNIHVISPFEEGQILMTVFVDSNSQFNDLKKKHYLSKTVS